MCRGRAVRGRVTLPVLEGDRGLCRGGSVGEGRTLIITRTGDLVTECKHSLRSSQSLHLYTLYHYVISQPKLSPRNTPLSLSLSISISLSLPRSLSLTHCLTDKYTGKQKSKVKTPSFIKRSTNIKPTLFYPVKIILKQLTHSIVSISFIADGAYPVRVTRSPCCFNNV